MRGDGADLIRHYWGRKAHCASPQYGQWGGPPGGRQPGKPAPAKDLASAPRGQVQLSQVVKSKVPALGLVGLIKGAKPVAPVPAVPDNPGPAKAPAGPGK